MISSIGSFTQISANSSAVNFKSNVDCIDVQSGLAILSSTIGFGNFSINCALNQQFNTFGLKLFPNPVQNKAKLKCTNFPPINTSFILFIRNSEGYLINTQKETGYTLTQGITLNLESLPAGTYILSIESSQFLDALKFIKIK
jgi:hypothetical protein